MKESMRIKPVRPFAREEIPQVADMFRRLLLQRRPSLRALPTTKLTEYFEQTFFHNPWYDEAFPWLVYQESNGKVIGSELLRLRFTDRPLTIDDIRGDTPGAKIGISDRMI